jgi:dimethylaniline monooxygenase (N-oxide forming)
VNSERYNLELLVFLFTQKYEFDFLIICLGRYGIAKVPTFPQGRGPEVFQGQVLHSMDYSRMPHADAHELIRGKRVVVVGSGKSGMDTVAQCARANGERDDTIIIMSFCFVSC